MVSRCTLLVLHISIYLVFILSSFNVRRFGFWLRGKENLQKYSHGLIPGLI